MKIKTCRHCGKEFTGTPNSQYCSPECRREKKREWERVSRKPKEAAICPICLNEFIKSIPTRIYCSNECATESRRQQYRASVAKKKISTMGELERFAVLALENNMTYGEYVAKKARGEI